MIEQEPLGRSWRGGLFCTLLLGLVAGTPSCGSSSEDDTPRARADGDEATDDDAVDDGDDDDGVSDTDDADSDGSSSSSGSNGSSILPDAEATASLCAELCEAWSGCAEVGGSDCVEECNEFSASSAAAGCYREAVMMFDCILASDQCPEQAACDAENEAYERCASSADDSTDVGPPGASATASDGTAASGSGGSGGAAPSNASDPGSDSPADVDVEVDPTESFGGEDMTPEAILEAAELPQCSEFEVEEFSCGSSSLSSGGSQCTVECYDPDDRPWTSFCRDGVCRCLYDGITYCQCPHVGMTDDGCNSCCPQLTDADFEF